MEQQVKNPLVIRCEYCAGDQSYDMVKQKYVCAHCGAEASPAQKAEEYRQWRKLRQNAIMRDVSGVKSFACPTCGAHTLASGEDASARCPFCQNTMIDATFSGNDLPEVILPFKISLEEAKGKLQEWLSNNKSNPAAEAIEKNLPRFTGCYLPYHIVRGAFNGDLIIGTQSGSSHYPFRAYLNHTAVNASKDLDNLFLDGIEPFDFDEAREFDFRLLIKQKAKIQNIDSGILANRIQVETKEELYHEFSKKVSTKEVTVGLHDQDNETLSALLPVYLVKCKNGIAAAVNGQTGKVSVATGKQKNLTGRWWLWPTLATLGVFILGVLFGILDSDMKTGFELGAMGGLVFGMVFFVIAHNRHFDTIVNEVLTYPKEKQKHNDTRAEFFADFGQGPVPAVLKFFTPWRIIKTILIALAVIFLPAIVAVPVQLLRGNPITDIQLGYGAAWYCIPGFFTILAAGGLAKAMMYGAPLYYEILPNGKTKRRRAVNQLQPSLKQVLSNSKFMLTSKAGCFVIGFILLLLVGSVAAMIS